MLCALTNHLPSGGHHTSRRRRHQFTPSIGESASQLEGRTLLSAAGGAASAAVAHHAAVEARHEARVVRHDIKLARHEARLEARHPSAAHAAAMARTQASLQAAIAADPTVSVSPSGVVTVTGPNGVSTSSIAGFRAFGNVNPGLTTGARAFGNVASGVTPGTIAATNPAAIGVPATPPMGLTSSVVGTINSQFPGAMVSGAGIPSIASNLLQMPVGTSIVAPAGGGFSLTTASPALSTLGTTGVLSQTNFVPTTPTGLNQLNGLTSPLGMLLTTGTVATPGLGTTTTGTTGLVPVSLLTFAPTPITTGASFAGTFNPSPVPLNGTLPFTGTPANPSPVPLNGTLPFTGSPINPSPIPPTGTLA